MKTSGHCPKCDATNLKIGKRVGQGGIMLSWFSGVGTDVYMCRGCGYTEEYVIDKHLKNKLQR